MSLKQLVNSHDVYKSFTDHIEKKIFLAQQALEVSVEPRDIYRLQGQIYVLRRLLLLREEVNSLDK